LKDFSFEVYFFAPNAGYTLNYHAMMFIKPEFYHHFSALLSETETAKMIFAMT